MGKLKYIIPLVLLLSLPLVLANCNETGTAIDINEGNAIVVLCKTISTGESYLIKRNADFDLSIPVVYKNNSPVGSEGTCNLIFTKPDSSILVNNELMNSTTNGLFNHSIDRGNLQDLGLYTGIVNCNSAGQSGSTTFGVLVTPTGLKDMLGYYVLAIILGYGILIFGILKDDAAIAMLGNFALFFIGIFMLFFGIDVAKNFFTDAIATITLGIAFYITYQVGMDMIGMSHTM